MSLCGHTNWCGADPRVVRLTDNGVRKVQITLETRWGKQHKLAIDVALSDAEKFIDELERALAWVEEEPA